MRFLFGIGGLVLWGLLAGSVMADITLPVAYVAQARPSLPTLSGGAVPLSTSSEAGARLAVRDNDTTGKFLAQRFSLAAYHFAAEATAQHILAQLEAAPAKFVVLDVPATTLEALLKQPKSAGYIWLNAGAPDDHLRQTRCLPHLLHTLPSRAMQADALAQYLATKRWKKWLLLMGGQPDDALFAAAMRRAAKRFGGQIMLEKKWAALHDARRTAQAEVPVMTQGAEYDVVVVADEADLFGEAVPYRTWLPRPVVGTHGLVAAGWHSSAEQWGAAQLQNRFAALAKRPMTARDYAAWAAVRTVGEAAARTQSAVPAVLLDYIRSDRFALAAFKGRSLSFRAWNGQLRQPMLLAQPNALVSVSPQEGFLHPKTELDTLGLDAAEVRCGGAANRL